MLHPTAVIDVVGLSQSLIGDLTPNLTQLAANGHLARMQPALPAVTTTVQSSMLTGTMPAEHGIVGNGWYNREMAEVQFWKQSNHLVHGDKVWDVARRRDPSFTCATMFWWYNMYASVDYAVTPRPMYKADGRKVPNVYTAPAELGGWLQGDLGRFPLFNFWGPAANLTSTRWIADASQLVYDRHTPTLTLVYLPHLDYGLQKLGPDHPDLARELTGIDDVVGGLVAFFRERGVRVMLLSEYGIEPVTAAISINRVLREDGALAVHVEDGLEHLDAGASRAFAVADHQVAHVYVRAQDDIRRYADLCRTVDGVEQVLDAAGKVAVGLNHPRAGDLVLVAAPGRWFSYDYWLDERCAPDFARTVEIHRKPGYDPLELFLDPARGLMPLRIAGKLIRKRLGFRTLMDLIPLDTSLVRGSHGRTDMPPERQPVLITDRPAPGDDGPLPVTAVREVILDHLFGDSESA